MSTFLGLIEEIPGISVDRFDEENLASSVFFLSHCHTDHMMGLSDTFFKHLEHCNNYLYCSPITKVLLENKYSFSSSRVKEIHIDNPTVIEYRIKNDDNIILTVTCVSAGHCPGSVMFVFEKSGISILYTGDFRINPIDFPKLKSLHFCEHSTLIPRTFNKIYLDTTLLSRNFSYLPTRQESMIKICDVTKEWLSKDPRNVVILECSALYGSEFIFMELAKFLKTKIHVKDYVYESYQRIMDLSCHVTNDPYNTPIHACKSKFSHPGLKCRSNVDETNIMTLIPSVMKWGGKDVTKVGAWDKVKERTFNVCYSSHSSLDELKAFITYFKALEVIPCVVKPTEKEEIYSLLHEIIQMPDEQSSLKSEPYKLELPSRKRLNNWSFKCTYFSDDDDDDDDNL